MSFFTAVNCIDGRVQLPVIEYLKKRYNVRYIDSITEPGPNLILAEETDKNLLDSILKRTTISITKHKSSGIAIVGHADCAGNPAGEKEQMTHIRKSVRFLRQQFPQTEIVGLWVAPPWDVREVEIGKD